MNKELILRVREFSKSYGTKTLVEDGKFNIFKEEKVALLGQNGTGKTTFVKCLVGDENYDRGIIEFNPDFRFAVMEQEKTFDEVDLTFQEYLDDKKNRLIKKREELEEKFADPEIYNDSFLYDKLMQDHAVLAMRSDMNIDETIIKELLEEIGFEMQDYGKKIKSLSGGQRTKLRLIEVLMQEVDFYIFDEPTNHLDFETIRWLEKRLFYAKKSFLVISHDRHFVGVTTNKIIEIENTKFQVYDCDYPTYRKKKQKHLDELAHKHYAITKEKKRLKESEKQKREWAHLVGSKKMRIQADKLERRANDLGDPPNPDDFIENYEINFGDGYSTTNLVFNVKELSKSFGNINILDNISFKVRLGDRIAILGKNGCGKTTLLKLLTQQDLDYEGSISIGQQLKIGYLDQEFKDMDYKQTLMDYLWTSDTGLMEHHVIANLIKFGFTKSRLKDKIGQLSGGEKTRLALLKLTIDKCNVLLLDEPTNNLDVELIENLEKALKKFRGAVVFVSHDRMFINKVAKKIFVIEDKKLEELEGNYSDNF